MPTVIGIDEAGYGPQLGPLTVAAAAFDVPDDDADLWASLAGAVAQARAGRAGRLLVADSKIVYAGGKGLADLERAVLAFLLAGGAGAPASFSGLLEHLCGDAGAARNAPWWNDSPLPVAADADGVRAAAASLADASGRVRVLRLAARIVPAGSFNALLTRHRNKSVLLFQQCMALVDDMLARLAGDLTFLIDKHGGRHYYDPLLVNHFFGRPVRTLSESPRSSSYEIALGDRTLRLTFAEKADAAHLPVALASMTAKYLRELGMTCFNAYWCGRVGGLRPTAGYAADSARFLAAIRPLLEDGDEHNLVRQR